MSCAASSFDSQQLFAVSSSSACICLPTQGLPEREREIHESAHQVLFCLPCPSAARRRIDCAAGRRKKPPRLFPLFHGSTPYYVRSSTNCRPSSRRRRRFLQVVNWSRRAFLIFIPTRGQRVRPSLAGCSNAHDWLDPTLVDESCFLSSLQDNAPCTVVCVYAIFSPKRKKEISWCFYLKI